MLIPKGWDMWCGVAGLTGATGAQCVEWVGRVTITRWVVALDRTAPGRGRLFCCFGQMQQPTQVSAVVSDVLECNWCPSLGLFIYESSVSLLLCNRSAGLTSRTPGARCWGWLESRVKFLPGAVRLL